METIAETDIFQLLKANAWSDYRSKQDGIVDHLLEMCGQDDNLHAFVKAQVWQQIAAKAFPVIPASALVSGTQQAQSHANDNLNSSCRSDMHPVEILVASSSSSDDDLEGMLDAHMPLDAQDVFARLLQKDLDDECEERAAAPQQTKQVELLDRLLGKEENEPGACDQIHSSSCDADASAVERCTSLMLRLSPKAAGVGRYRKTQLAVLKHICSKYKIVGGQDFDFLYFPATFGQLAVKGYGIINFRDPDKAASIASLGGEWSWADSQGFVTNCQRFLKRHDRVRNTMLRPMVWLDPNNTSPRSLDQSILQEFSNVDAVPER